MAQDYDFFVSSGSDSLGFNTAIGTERPYERATAQFRKDQLDQGATVGDQSLTGWWTRGQLSFHKGAGVKYYEVLGDSDDSVENRFRAGEGINPWTPGEVSLANDLPAVSGWTVDCYDIAPSPYTIGGDLVAVGVDGIVRKLAGTTITTIASPVDAFPFTWLAMSPSDVWVASATKLTQVNASLTWAASGGGFRGVWWMKDRAWVVDSLGKWYTFASGSSGTLNPADTFWASGIRDADLATGPWQATEAPACVYLAQGGTIYRVGLGDDGLVPTVTYAGVAATMPVGETIAAIRYYLGRVVIATTSGVRLAVPQADNSLIYGPLVMKGDFFGPGSVNRRRKMGAQGNLVLLVGLGDDDPGSAGLYELDLSEGDALTAPWVRRKGLATTGGVAISRGNSVYVFGHATGTLYVDKPDDVFVSAGSLTTGLHRFGTLEPKAFCSLTIKVGGDGGYVNAYALTPEGVEYFVGTTESGTTATFDLTDVPGFTNTLEYLGVRFMLFAHAPPGGDYDSAPTLLGYQLKALPVPKRQRMIRVPLMLADSEENRRGQTMLANPWTRLAALEDLEQTNALVSFEDKETGETGSAYIESVEVTRTAPGSPVGGFGGFIFLTLRVL